MRRRLWAILAAACLAVGSSAPAEGVYPIITDPVVALVDESGENLMPENSFQEVFFLREGELYAIGSRERYFLMNEDGSLIPAVPMDMANVFGDVIIYRRNGLYGAMNLEGEILVQPEWTQLVPNDEDGFLAMSGSPFDESADEIIYIDSVGEIMPTGSFTVGGLKQLSYDRMPIIASDGRYGYIDGRGRLVQPIEWLYAGSFKNGAALISGESGMGLVDAAGNILLEPAYSFIERGEKLTAVLDGAGTLTVYNVEGAGILFTMQIPESEIAVVGDGIAVISDEDSRLYNSAGQCILSASPGTIYTSGLNGQFIISDGEWGETCQWVINPDGSPASGKYQRILPLAGERYAFMTMFGASYYSDELDSIQKSWNYESVRYGMMDSSGREILPAEYLEIRALSADRFLLISENGVFFADAEGNTIREWLTAEDESASF